MNPDILERLIIDRALGHLQPDVEALLDEHLKTNPEQGASLSGYDETVRLARVVIRSSPLKSEPPVESRSIVRLPAFQAWPIAAAFMIGAGITFASFHLPQSPHLRDDVRHAGPPLAEPRPSPEIERAARALPFWSAKRATLLVAASKNLSEKEVAQ